MCLYRNGTLWQMTKPIYLEMGLAGVTQRNHKTKTQTSLKNVLTDHCCCVCVMFWAVINSLVCWVLSNVHMKLNGCKEDLQKTATLILQTGFSLQCSSDREEEILFHWMENTVEMWMGGLLFIAEQSNSVIVVFSDQILFLNLRLILKLVVLWKRFTWPDFSV